jgi:hypothetical protein
MGRSTIYPCTTGDAGDNGYLAGLTITPAKSTAFVAESFTKVTHGLSTFMENGRPMLKGKKKQKRQKKVKEKLRRRCFEHKVFDTKESRLHCCSRLSICVAISHQDMVGTVSP